MEDRIKTIMADILDVPMDMIQDGFGPDDTLSWDSMNNLRLVTAIEEEFNIKLSMDDINRMVDFGKVKTVLSGYLPSQG
jgi:acyl carrier protein